MGNKIEVQDEEKSLENWLFRVEEQLMHSHKNVREEQRTALV